MSVNGLERMTQQILSEAWAQADAVLAAAREECARINAESVREAREIRERLTKEAETAAAALIAETKASALNRKNELILAQKSALVDRVFSHTLEETVGLERGKYTELLGGILAAAIYEFCRTDVENRAYCGDDEDGQDEAFEVILNKKDRDTCGEGVLALARRRLSGKVPEDALRTMTLSRKAYPMQGGVVLCRGPVEYNCSFEALFSQLRRELEQDVCRALFDFRGNGL